MYSINFKQANCKSCYKCLRSCPVKAIRFKEEQAEIVEDRCIACGICLNKCPQNARYVISDIDKVKEFINNGEKVIVSVAPSFVGYFGEDYEQFIDALYKMGIYKVLETAEAATIISRKYKDYINESKQKYYITTSCPAVNNLIQKYYPKLIKYMIPYVSPMIAHGKFIKTKEPQAKVVFVGPCVAKKVESHEKGNEEIIDAVLTFEEVQGWINKHRDSADNKKHNLYDNGMEGHNFPIEGGIIKAMGLDVNEENISCLSVSGVVNLMHLFKSFEEGEIDSGIYEVSSCSGSCVGGINFNSVSGYYKRLKLVKNYIKSKKALNNKNDDEVWGDIDFSKKFKDKSLHKRNIMEEEINKILRKMGKHSEKDEMNCGVCGYDSCREKAIAILEGMAEPTMCLSYMRNKAEGFANIVFEHTANSVIILDLNLNVIEFSPAAEKAFMMDKENILGKPISNLVDDKDFREILVTKKNIIGKKVVYNKYGLTFLQNIIYLKKHEMVFVTMLNISEAEKNKQELLKVKENTLDAAQRVIDKQMRVAQEIAGLLGETTAETKVILTRLKKVVAGDEVDML